MQAADLRPGGTWKAGLFSDDGCLGSALDAVPGGEWRFFFFLLNRRSPMLAAGGACKSEAIGKEAFHRIEPFS